MTVIELIYCDEYRVAVGQPVSADTRLVPSCPLSPVAHLAAGRSWSLVMGAADVEAGSFDMAQDREQDRCHQERMQATIAFSHKHGKARTWGRVGVMGGGDG